MLVSAKLCPYVSCRFKVVSSPDDAVWEAVSVLAVNQKTKRIFERITAKRELSHAELNGSTSRRILRRLNEDERRVKTQTRSKQRFTDYALAGFQRYPT